MAGTVVATRTTSAKRGSRFLRLLAVAIALIALVAVGGQWLTGASAFTSGSEISVDVIDPGAEYHFSLTGVARGMPDVKVRDVRIDFAPGSGAASADVRVCPVVLGAYKGKLPVSCAPGPIEGLDLGTFDSRHTLVLTLVPDNDTPVVVDAVRVRFSKGLRSGDQAVGPGIAIGAASKAAP